MIRFRLPQLIAEWEYKKNQKLTLTALAERIDVHRATLRRIAREEGYNTTTDVVDKLCTFFGCGITDLIELVPDKKASRRASSSK